MFAAHGLIQMGWDVTIFSQKRRSQMFGAQYLHKPIEGLPCGDPTPIEYQLIGTVEQYALKVYGPEMAAGLKVSPSLLPKNHDAWSIRSAYYAAYERYNQSIVDCLVDRSMIHGMFRKGNPNWSLAINTIPLKSICWEPAHQFTSQKIWAAGDAPELDRWCPVTCPPNTVICNGERDQGWYRVSNVHGYNTAEWPYDRKPPIEGLGEVEKPLSNNCDCLDAYGIIAAGRYGKWQKDVLAHHPYLTALIRGGRR